MKLSLNEPAEEEEIRGGGGGQQPGQHSRDVIYSCEFLTETASCCIDKQVDGRGSEQKEEEGRQPCCWRMQPAFSPLCVVSARITTVTEEEMRGRRMARKSGCPTIALHSV